MEIIKNNNFRIKNWILNEKLINGFLNIRVARFVTWLYKAFGFIHFHTAGEINRKSQFVMVLMGTVLVLMGTVLVLMGTEVILDYCTGLPSLCNKTRTKVNQK